MADDLPQPYVPAPLDFSFGESSSRTRPPRKVATLRKVATQAGGAIKDGKLHRVGIVRDSNTLYFIKAGDIWAMPRREPGQPQGQAVKLTSIGFEMDYARYLYYVDGDGDIAVKARG